MYSFPTSSLYEKKHGALSDFVPNRHGQKDNKIPISWT